jgi:hypothetical protein
MSHLSIETLARLVDESAESHEAEHLEQCELCRTELEGLRADAAELARLPELEPPATQWLAIEQRLAAEGLLRKQPRAWSRAWARPLLQMAAAIAVFLLGSYSAPLLARLSPSFTARSVAQQSGSTRGVRNVANVSSINTTQEAADAVRQTEQAYLNALTHYTELAGRTEAADPVARLAALESIVLTTRAALGQAPADPVINGYHLTALAQRDATIKQLASKSKETWF